MTSLTPLKWLLAITWLGNVFVSKAVASPPATRPTEVVIVSTEHFLTDMPDGYTPGHLRALLDRVSPDIILVEASANVRDPWTTAPNELTQVTRPWAIERNVPAIPVGWNNADYQNQIGEMLDTFHRSGKMERYTRIEASFQKDFAEHPWSCVWMNSADWMARWRDYHSQLHQLFGKDTPWEQWNSRIFTNVKDICHKHSGCRLAIVFGGAHAYFLTDSLSSMKEIHLIPAENFLPLSTQEIQAHTKPGDYVHAMRLLNFAPGQLSAEQLANLQTKLDRLKKFGQFSNDFQYFSARLLLHQHQPEKAMKILGNLSETPEGVLLSFDGTTPVRDAARLQICFALQEQGDSPTALLKLQAIAHDDHVAAPIRDAANSMLGEMTPK